MNIDDKEELIEDCDHAHSHTVIEPCDKVEGNVDIVDYCPMCESWEYVECKPQENKEV